ncbi:hypothetical protein QUF80_21295 [Desulfococcaceae bacterium HSG8]|nr:hypothetical protein [Desulfococcaceae bacterium HSG8]
MKLSALNNLSIRTKFLIVGGSFLIVSFFSTWGMKEMATANLLQKMERDHIEFTTRLEYQAKEYIAFLEDSLGDSRTQAYKILHARSDDSRKMGLLQLMEKMMNLQIGVFTVTSPMERKLFRWFGFGEAFDLAASADFILGIYSGDRQTRGFEPE